jgi:aminoglycoside/choline kinase family phosphotransferase
VITEAELSALLADAGFAVAAVTALQGDVSPRRYARVTLAGGGTAIAAHYPEELRDTAVRFLRTTELLTEAGIRVPAVLATDLHRGWMLLEDLGPATVFELDRPATQRAAIAAAVALLPRLRALSREALAALNPSLDAALLRRELRQTEELVLRPLALAPDLSETCARCFDVLCQELGRLPPVACHRDLMARNLVLLASGELAVLDHQDLRLGPAVYDLASLLNDSYFAAAADEQAWLAQALPAGHTQADYLRAVAQRTLKACGTFAAFARRGVRRHLPLVAPAWRRACRALEGLPEGSGVGDALAAAWDQAGPEPTLLLH